MRLTLDGVPILLHDATLDRMWGAPRPSPALTADELSPAPAAGCRPWPTRSASCGPTAAAAGC